MSASINFTIDSPVEAVDVVGPDIAVYAGMYPVLFDEQLIRVVHSHKCI